MNATGWGIMIGWITWILFLPILLEIFEIIFKVKDEHDLLVEKDSGKHFFHFFLVYVYKKVFDFKI